jgi:hypothetical protein
MTDNIILNNLKQPEVLEQKYQDAPDEFEKEFKEAFESNSDSETLKVWNARLSYRPLTSSHKASIGLVILLCLVAGLFAKAPSFLPIEDDWYYPRYIPLVVITCVILYFIKTAETILTNHQAVITGIVLSSFYLSALPHNTDSASITMALIHIPLFLLTLLAVSFMAENWRSVAARLNFIRYLGEMGIYSALIILGGMVLTGITFALFNMIGLSIEKWYIEYIVVLGLVSSPVVATYVFDSIQNRQSKIAPILSNVFAPLFLLTVVAYLVATIYQGKSPFTDRDFLITFNGLLVVILALTIFSISGKKRTSAVKLSDYINVSLVTATLIINVVALSAIIFRWAEHGVTVNRVVVTGANILIFVHLILILRHYYSHLKHGDGIERLEVAIARYLPVYTAWSLIVAIVIPIVFQFE